MNSIILFIFELTFVSLSSCEILKGREDASKCKSKPCITIENLLLKKSTYDNVVRPCDDFFAYVCTNESFMNPFLLIEANTILKLYRLINEPSLDGEPEHLKKLKRYYASCTDEVRLDKNSEKNFKRIRNNLGGWPVVDKITAWTETKYQWPNIVRELRKAGYTANYFFSLEIDVADNDATKKMIHLDQPTFGLEQFYLVQGRENPEVQKYLDYMVRLAEAFGADDIESARQELERSLEFEIELAQISHLPKDRQDHRKIYNVMTIDELQSTYPDIKWLDHLNGILRPCAKLRANDKINVRVPRFFEKFFKLINKRQLTNNDMDITNRDLANYALWRVCLDSVDYLSSSLRGVKSNADVNDDDDDDNDRTDLLRIDRVSDRELGCVYEMKEKMYVAMSSLYVKYYYNENVDKPIRRLFGNVRASLGRIISENDWMDGATKEAALDKLNSAELSMGYPDDIIDDAKLDNYYRDFEPNEKNYLNSTLNFNKFHENSQFKELRKQFDKNDWTLFYRSAVIVNAMNSRMNTIYLPAALMNSLLYSRDNPNYMNYGILGYILGHELIHSFDNKLRFYDKHGNLYDWWSNESTVRYDEKSRCIVEHYGNYRLSDDDDGDAPTNIDGVNTLAENMADIGGLRAAYRAYRTTLRRDKKNRRDNDKNKQLFWISYAQLFCDRMTTNAAAMKKIAALDEHAPSRYRVVGSLKNLPEFANDFRCRRDDFMYSDSGTRCDMW